MTLILPATLGALGVLMIVAAARALQSTPPSSARAHAQAVMRGVWADGEWTDGATVVWRDSQGLWHLEEPELGTLILYPGEVQSELESHYWRATARVRREVRS